MTLRDRDIRTIVRPWLTSVYVPEGSGRIVEEMGLWSGSVRADLAAIGSEMVAVEIKSDVDTLNRLPAQVDLYNAIFDRVYLVTGTKHLTKARTIVPPWWGLKTVCLNGSALIEDIRSAQINPNIIPIQLARLLWRDEAVEILERRGLIDGHRRSNKEQLLSRLVENALLDDIRREVRSALMRRETWLRRP